MFTFITRFEENKILQQKTVLSITRIDFALRVSSRAIRVFPALWLRCVRPSYGTFFLMVFHGNCARGRTGHMIKRFYLLVKTITVEPLLSGHLLTGHPQAASYQSPESIVSTQFSVTQLRCHICKASKHFFFIWPSPFFLCLASSDRPRFSCFQKKKSYTRQWRQWHYFK